MNAAGWISKCIAGIGRIARPTGGRRAADPVHLEAGRLPRHIAIIMDGNGRWAEKRGMPRSVGHHAGTEAIRGIIRECDALKIEALTIYAFSTENWNRPQDEVGTLMSLLVKFFKSEIDELHEKRVCIRILGDVDGLPEPQRGVVLDAMRRTAKNDGLKLNIALNYGGRNELLRAARKLARMAVDGRLVPEQISADDLAAQLYTRDLPEVDLVVRTSGEMRLSNFLLYQTAYAEMVFNDTLWPDYDREQLHHDLMEYARRNRRFGKIK